MITKTRKNLIFPSCFNLLASTLIWCVNNAMFSAMNEAIEYRPIVFEQCRKHLFLPGFYVHILSICRITIIQFIQKRMYVGRPNKKWWWTYEAREERKWRSTLEFLTTLDAQISHDARRYKKELLDARRHEFSTHDADAAFSLDARRWKKSSHGARRQNKIAQDARRQTYNPPLVEQMWIH